MEKVSTNVQHFFIPPYFNVRRFFFLYLTQFRVNISIVKRNKNERGQSEI